MRYPNLNTRLLYLFRYPGVGWFAHKLLRFQGTQINRAVVIGNDCVLVRSGTGTVIDAKTVIGDRVRIFHQVTIGRAHPLDDRSSDLERVIIGNDVMIGAGAKVLCGPGETLTIGDRAMIGANAVVTKSVGPDEVWGGVPAVKIRDRSVS
jgi:serine O-acetyltransferase